MEYKYYYIISLIIDMQECYVMLCYNDTIWYNDVSLLKNIFVNVCIS